MNKKLQLFSLAVILVTSACSKQPGGNVQRIAVKALRAGLIFNDYKVYTVSLDGKINERLPRGLGDQPDWSPDGQWIVFSTLYPRSLFKDVYDSEIYLLPASGRDPFQIIETEYGSISPTWSNDGEKIAYESSERIYTLNIACILLQANMNGCELIPQLLTKGWDPDWSPTSSHIVFSTREGRIFLVDADQGGHPQEIAPPNEEYCYHPKWSPDGTKIVNGCLGRIYILSADGGVEMLFPEERVRGAYPDWSLNGDKILFVSDRAEDLNQPMNAEGIITSDALFSINVDGTDLVRLTQRSDEHILWFSPMPVDK
jgi:Tol biopolymer transport system component